MKTAATAGVVSALFFSVIGAAPADAQNWAEAPGSPYAAASFPQAMTVTPDGDLLYVLNSVPSSPNSVSAYRINADNTLSEISGSPFAVDQNAVDLATDGRFLYTANGVGSDTVGAYAIDPSGALSSVGGSPFSSGGSAPQNLEVAPSGEYVVVTNAASDNFDIFVINGATGALSAMTGSPFAAGDEPQGVSIGPGSTRVIISNCLDDTLSVYEVDPLAGDFTEVSGSPFSGPDCPDASVLDDDGRYLYVDGLNSFDGYAVEDDGTLTKLSGSPFPPIGYNTDQGIALAWRGDKVFTIGRTTSTDQYSLVVFEVLPDGNLTREVFSPVPLVRTSFEVVAHPQRDVVFLADSLDDSVTVVEAVVLSGLGTPIIDGARTPGEWDGADVAEFPVSLLEGGTTDGTLLVMNDATNLYLAVETGSIGSAEQGGVSFDFDHDMDGECDGGDDSIGVSDGGILDAFWSAGCMTGDFDTADGGTSDGAAASNGAYTFFEMSHPLDSGDVGHDIALGAGSRVGFLLNVRTCGYPDCVDTYFPGSNLAYQGHILIDGSQIFVDDFESHDTSRWSGTFP